MFWVPGGTGTLHNLGKSGDGGERDTLSKYRHSDNVKTVLRIIV